MKLISIVLLASSVATLVFGQEDQTERFVPIFPAADYLPEIPASPAADNVPKELPNPNDAILHKSSLPVIVAEAATKPESVKPVETKTKAESASPADFKVVDKKEDDRPEKLVELVDDLPAANQALEAVKNAESADNKILRDSIIRPSFQLHPLGFPAALPARPIFAARPAIAIQPVAAAPLLPCPLPPRRPRNSEYCEWNPVRDGRGCIASFECEPIEAPHPACPSRVPVKPDIGEYCNWIPILDKNNCILRYVCEPVIPEICDPAPLYPDDNNRCKWIALKDSKGCILNYVCVPFLH